MKLVLLSALATLLAVTSVDARRKVPWYENPQWHKHTDCQTDCPDQNGIRATSTWYFYGETPGDQPDGRLFYESEWGGYYGRIEETNKLVIRSMCNDNIDSPIVKAIIKSEDFDHDPAFPPINDICMEAGLVCAKVTVRTCHSCAKFQCVSKKWIPNIGTL